MPNLLGRKGGESETLSLERSVSRTPSGKGSTLSSRKPSVAQLDDWTDGFTGLVDLDRRMRDLAMAESFASSSSAGDGIGGIEAHIGREASDSLYQQHRRKSTSDARFAHLCYQPGSSSSASILSMPTTFSRSNVPSSNSTAATSRFSQDSPSTSGTAEASLLAKRRASATDADSQSNLRSSLRLTPLPASSSPFGSFRLQESNSFSASDDQTCFFSTPRWNLQDPFSPAAEQVGAGEPLMTPRSAAAATWIDPSAPGYFPAGLSSERKSRSSLKKKAPRISLPRLISGEVMPSPLPASPIHEDEKITGSEPDFSAPRKASLMATSDAASLPPSTSDKIKRSAGSLALGLRFKVVQVKRKIKKTSQIAADPHTTSQLSDRRSTELRI